MNHMKSRANAIIIGLVILGNITQAVKEDKNFWMKKGREEIKAALNLSQNKKVAKNVILFVGDGMGPNTITAARIYKGGEESYLSFEKFPYIGLLKTYNVDKQVPDSAATATALFAGVKTNYKTAGVDANVRLGDCAASLKKEFWTTSLMDWGQDAGKATGMVTNARVTHATPCALYSHTSTRKWECEAEQVGSDRNCKDIARQLVEDLPGKNINVILGGGLFGLQSDSSGPKATKWDCQRKDGRNLVKDWMVDKSRRKLDFKYVRNSGELKDIDYAEVEFLLGIFAHSHMDVEHLRDKSNTGQPSLTEMTVAAIKVLQKKPEGFVLVVEGAHIDSQHHFGKAKYAITETLAFDVAVRETMTYLKMNGMVDDTLVIVTSDHTHTLSITGYPPRDNSIFGISQQSEADGVPYTTLLYATVNAAGYKYQAKEEGGRMVVERKDPSTEDTEDYEYHQLGGVLTHEGAHGGGEVAVYATGPWAHLFHSVHEQNYVAHVIAYAAHIGPYSSERMESVVSTNKAQIISPFPACAVIIIYILNVYFLQ